MDNTKCKYLKPTFGFMLCGEYEYQTHCCDVKDCYFKQSSAYQQQYTAVVAQNKNLQGELNVYKIMVKNLIMLKAGEYSKYHQTFTKFKIQALEELEAEND